MKNYFLTSIIIGSSALLFSACNHQEADTSNRETDSLLSVVNERNASINDFIISFNEVESNLDSVAMKQQLISMNTEQKGELKTNQKARINEEIAAINNLMEQNRKKIAELNHKLKGSSTRNAELEKAIVTMNNQLAQKNAELTALNEKLNNLNAQVAQLQTSVTALTDETNSKSQTIAEETKALHTAYYVIGNSNDLKDAKIIDRKGGLLGIGRTSKLNGDFDNSKFIRIDYTQTGTISVNSEMKMITSHPSDSYTLDTETKDKDKVKNIVITNPEKFWSASKYLVVVKD
jgi:DNA repair exonuclease SbcCD ATPase subunit